MFNSFYFSLNLSDEVIVDPFLSNFEQSLEHDSHFEEEKTEIATTNGRMEKDPDQTNQDMGLASIIIVLLAEIDGSYEFDIMIGDDIQPLNENRDISSDSAQNLDEIAIINLLPEGTNFNHDFVYYDQPVNGIISDRLWLDSDGDGVQDPNESGINGVIVKLINNETGEVVATDITSGNGNYHFEGLSEGSYTVVVDKTLSEQIAQKEKLDASFNPNGMIDELWKETHLSHGGSEHFWFDLDQDGLQDFNEVGNQNIILPILSEKNNQMAINDFLWGKDHNYYEEIDQDSYDEKTDINFLADLVKDISNPYLILDNISSISELSVIETLTTTLPYDEMKESISKTKHTSDTHKWDDNYDADSVLLSFEQNIIVEPAFLNFIKYNSDLAMGISDRQDAHLFSVSDSLLNRLIKKDNLTYGKVRTSHQENVFVNDRGLRWDQDPLTGQWKNADLNTYSSNLEIADSLETIDRAQIDDFFNYLDDSSLPSSLFTKNDPANFDELLNDSNTQLQGEKTKANSQYDQLLNHFVNEISETLGSGEYASPLTDLYQDPLTGHFSTVATNHNPLTPEVTPLSVFS